MPSIVAGGVLNAADGSRQLAPGSLVSIWGSNLAPATAIASVMPLPATLEGVAVEVVDAGRTFPAALWFVSPGQINAQLPFGLSGGTVQVRVKTRTGTSNTETAPIVARAPRLFSKSMTGKGEPLLIHADYTLVAEQTPAMPGEAVFAYVNGMGEVTPALAAGQAGGDGAKTPLNKVSQDASVTVGGRPAVVYFAGMAPGFVVYQVNFQIPPDVPAGPQPVVITIGQSASQPGVEAAIGRKLPVIATGTIGGNGGVIASGGTVLTIPAGALASPATIQLARTQASPITSADPAEFLVLTGMPETWSAPLTVSLELPSGIAQPGEKFLVMQSKSAPEGTGMQVLDATVNGSVITAVIPAVEELDSVQSPKNAPKPAASFEPSGPEISFYMMAFYTRIKSPSGKFMIFYPAEVKGLDLKAERAGVILDEAYKKLEAFGLSWAKRTREIRVVIHPFPPEGADRWGEQQSSRLGPNYSQMSINSTKLMAATDEIELRASIAHELFHVMQVLYEARGAFRAASSAGTWLWYLEAASTWFESVFLANDNYIPGQVSDDNYAFLTRHGLEFPPGDTKDVAGHGYGASLFLRYLAKTGGPTVIGNILKRGATRTSGLIANPVYSPVAALDVEASASPSWNGFVREYMNGKLTPAGYPQKSNILGLQGGKCVLTEGGYCPAIAWDAPDLSARFTSIYVNKSWGTNTTLTFEMDDPGGGTEAVLYKTAANLEIVGSFRAGKFVVASAEKLAAESSQLVLVLINSRAVAPFTGLSAVAVRIGVQTAAPQYRVVTGAIPASRCSLTRYTSTPPTTGLGICQDLVVSNYANWTYLQGTVPMVWSGPSFSSAGKLTTGNYSCEIKISGQVSPDAKSVVGATFSKKCRNVVSDGTTELEIAFTITDIPFTGGRDDNATRNYGITGADARQHVTLTKYLDVYKNPDGSLKYETKVTGPNTDVMPVVGIGMQ